MKVIVKETERGFLFKKGQFVRMLHPGVYHVFGSTEIEVLPLSVPPSSQYDNVMRSMFSRDAAYAEETISVKVDDAHVALHFVDGNFAESLSAGEYTFWNQISQHRFDLYDITQPCIPDTIPRHICEALCKEDVMFSIRVPDFCKGLLKFDGKLEELLEPGVYYFWKQETGISCDIADMRQQQLSITGQEILTKDKVNIRLNFVCSYSFGDYVKVFREIKDYASQFYVMVQMTMREHIAGCTLDEVLSQRESIASAVTERLKERAKSLYLEVVETGIRDIILPGEVRDIMNTVLIAEKRAQANVITRREEVASTRSLLNTAKLMDENKTLYKLKELEYLEKICENVGNISVSGGDLLAQLQAIVGTKT